MVKMEACLIFCENLTSASGKQAKQVHLKKRGKKRHKVITDLDTDIKCDSVCILQ